jgi:uncharacterized membrane protein YfhO
VLFLDLVSEDCECSEKHHASEDKQLRSKENHRKTNAFKEFEKKHVVVITQRSVSIVQIVSSQINNAFDVLKNRSNSRIKSELTFTQKTKNAQTQFTLKLKDRSSNSRKTTKSTQNEEL